MVPGREGEFNPKSGMTGSMKVTHEFKRRFEVAKLVEAAKPPRHKVD
jgi:hypothetical protein